MNQIIAESCLIYLSLGIATAFAGGIVPEREEVAREFVRRHGRLPGRLFETVVAVVLAVAHWPKVFWELARS